MLKLVNHSSESTLSHPSRALLSLFILPEETGTTRTGTGESLMTKITMSSLETQSSEEMKVMQLGGKMKIMQLGGGKMITQPGGQIAMFQEETGSSDAEWITKDTEKLKMTVGVIWFRTELIAPECIGMTWVGLQWLQALFALARGFVQPQFLLTS